MLKNAILMAIKAHAGQVEKSGGAYISHPLRVLELLMDEDYLTCVVGVLHDVVEDSDVTLEDVRREFSDEVADAVDSVTRRESETYFEFVERAMKHPVGRKVKLADLKDHLRPGHEDHIPESLIKRYKKALVMFRVSSVI
jgi:(p)ppGpp synthase/HD superfamily hydrolase